MPDLDGQEREVFRCAFVTKKHPEGWEYRASPYGTAAALFDALWKEHPRKLKAPDLSVSTRFPDRLAAETVERPYTWVRPREDEPSSPHLRFLQAYDINGQFLSACSGLVLPIGDPRELNAPMMTFSNAPGYHLIDRVDSAYRYPAVLEPGWHTTPIVAVARQVGGNPVISRSLIWDKSCKALDPWYKTMRDARTRLLAEPEALGLLKDCYTKFIGALRGKDARARNPKMYQPAWYDHIVSQANARQFLLINYFSKMGVPVLAVHLDTVIIESSNDVPQLAPPGMTLSTQLGKYKPAGVITAKEGHALLYPEGKRTNIHALTKRLREAK